MNTQKAVFKKLAEAKVELATQKVELGNLKTLDSIIRGLKDSNKRSSRMAKEVKDSIASLNGNIRKLNIISNESKGLINEGQQEVNELTQSLKELNMQTKDIPSIKEFEIFAKEAADFIKFTSKQKKH